MSRSGVSRRIAPRARGSGDVASLYGAGETVLVVDDESAYSPEAIAHDGLLEEGAAFLRKPFEIGLLLQAVRRTLDAAGAA